MKPIKTKHERGAALIVFVVIVVLGASAYVLSALNAASRNADLSRRQISSKALAEAKQALLGYVATLAASDANPGRLPCPEALGYATNADPDDDGVAQGGTCLLPAVGRLPWRTLGISKLTDGYGEPLWYVVSPGFAWSPSLSINSNTAAQLTVDGMAGGAVALIIAPGPPMNVNIDAATGCTARVQQRNFPASFDLRDYLECENASTELTPGPYRFATNAPFVLVGGKPVQNFNDQVTAITHAELWNAVEPVVAKRIETQIVPVLKTVYAGSDWSTTTANPVYPSAVTFTDPSTSIFLGALGENRGLLPMFTMATNPTHVVWYSGSSSNRPTVSQVGGSGSVTSFDCSSAASTTINASCSVTYDGSPRIEIRASARRVARTMRQLNLAAVPLTWADPVNPSPSVYAAFIPSTAADAYVFVQANLPNSPGTTTTVTVPIGVLADHSLTDPNNAATAWFVKNNWHHLVYYAFAPSFEANGSLSCTNNSTCLTVTNLTPTGKQRAILIFAGRALGAQARPSGNESDYFEDPENYDGDRTYVKPTISKTTNDRVVVIDANP